MNKDLEPPVIHRATPSQIQLFYKIICIFSLAGLIVLCMPPALSNLPFVDRLVLRSDQWDLKLNDPDLKYFKEDDAAGKADLLRFLVRYPSYFAK